MSDLVERSRPRRPNGELGWVTGRGSRRSCRSTRLPRPPPRRMRSASVDGIVRWHAWQRRADEPRRARAPVLRPAALVVAQQRFGDRPRPRPPAPRSSSADLGVDLGLAAAITSTAAARCRLAASRALAVAVRDLGVERLALLPSPRARGPRGRSDGACSMSTSACIACSSRGELTVPEYSFCSTSVGVRADALRFVVEALLLGEHARRARAASSAQLARRAIASARGGAPRARARSGSDSRRCRSRSRASRAPARRAALRARRRSRACGAAARRCRRGVAAGGACRRCRRASIGARRRRVGW